MVDSAVTNWEIRIKYNDEFCKVESFLFVFDKFMDIKVNIRERKIGGIKKKKSITVINKRLEAVESHDHLCPEEKKMLRGWFLIIVY